MPGNNEKEIGLETYPTDGCSISLSSLSLTFFCHDNLSTRALFLSQLEMSDTSKVSSGCATCEFRVKDRDGLFCRYLCGSCISKKGEQMNQHAWNMINDVIKTDIWASIHVFIICFQKCEVFCMQHQLESNVQETIGIGSFSLCLQLSYVWNALSSNRYVERPALRAPWQGLMIYGLSQHELAWVCKRSRVQLVHTQLCLRPDRWILAHTNSII